ncbi:MAG TPA: DUF2156 domain-containing protein [Trueperaceae bacterium]
MNDGSPVRAESSDSGTAGTDSLQEPTRRERARRLVLSCGWNSTAYQILNPGIDLWFGDDDYAVVGFVSRWGVRVAAGAPVCAPELVAAAVAEFEADAASEGERVCWFGAEPRLEELLGGERAMVKLGAQPVWNPQEWQARVHGRSSIRAQLNRARNKGVSVSEWSPRRASGNSELRSCLREWLERRGLPPLHFLIESDTLDRLEDRRLFVAERAGDVLGFVVASPVPARDGWLIEQVVRRPTAVNGTAELMIDTAVRELAESGSSYLTLGLAPLASIGPNRGRESWWLRLLLAWARAHGRRFYNFRGLEFFKSKFRPPRWDPIYVIDSGSRVSPRTIYAVAAAFSEGPPLLMLARALAGALFEELLAAAPGKR